jgi:hypothetical protein
MWLKVDTIQVEALRQILALLSPLPSERVSMKILVDGPSVEFIDVSIPGEDIGISLHSSGVSIGSGTRGIDERYELADYGSPELLVREAAQDFGRILTAHGILAPVGGRVPGGRPSS